MKKQKMEQCTAIYTEMVNEIPEESYMQSIYRAYKSSGYSDFRSFVLAEGIA